MNITNETSSGAVMIVDDAPGNLAYLSDALRDAGYQVLVATDGIAALEQLQFVTPDVILLDAIMPGMDGFATCRRLKENPDTSDIPILFMTALGELEHLLNAFNEGAVDYLVKPVRHEEVLVRVGAHMSQVRNIRRASEALRKGGFSALAVDRNGLITWCTGSAVLWLQKFSDSTPADPKPGTALPPQILDWYLRQFMQGEEGKDAQFTVKRDNEVFNVRGVLNGDANEHLLLLHSRMEEWDLESVRGDLGLTLREAEVIMWIARGKTNKDIAQIFGGSPRTVNKHLEHIFEKLGVETRTAAVSVLHDKMRSR